jgi:subtilisin family serine protease
MRLVHLAIFALALQPGAGALADALVVRSSGALPTAMQSLMAELVKPATRIFPANVAAEEVVRQHCGGSYTNDYIREVVRINADFKLGPSPFERKFQMPFCAPSAVRPVVTVAPGDTIATLARKAFGVAPETTVTLCDQKIAQNALKCTQPAVTALRFYARDQVDTLVPGSTMTLPRLSVLTAVELKDGIKGSDAVDRIKNLAKQISSAGGDAAVSQLDAAGSFSLLGLVGPGDPRVRQTTCAPGEGDPLPHWPFNNAALAATLDYSLQRAKALNLRINPTVIRIVDTGVMDVRNIFPARALSVHSRLAAGEQVTNNNGYYGYSAEPNGNVNADPDDPDRWHGTQVADTALGGQSFRTAYQGVYDLVQVSFFKIFTRKEGKTGVSEGAMLKSMDPLEHQAGPHIVNFSVGGPDEQHTTGFKTYLGKAADRPFLAIVAAGNQGNNLSVKPMFPAAYSGDGSPVAPFMMVVGASTPEQELTAFSNHSAQYVDILAPGCRMVFRTPSGEIFTMAGTSIAAPQVSFAAALVRALGEENWKRVKNRLIASADFHPSLKYKARSSAVLNIERAAALFQDSLKTGKEPDRRGEWQHGLEMDEICAQLSGIPARWVLAIHPYTIAGKVQLRVLYRTSQDDLDHLDDCIPKTAGVTFKDETGSHPYAWKDITALVPSQWGLAKNH